MPEVEREKDTAWFPAWGLVMKKLLLSTAVLALTANAALAADLPTRKAPAFAPPPPMWTGFYAGLNAGYNFGTNSNVKSYAVGSDVWAGNYTGSDGNNGKIVAPLSVANTAGPALSGNNPMNMTGFIGGGQIGYNYQFGSNIVIGLEADIQGSGYRGTSQGTGASSAAVTVTDFFGAAVDASNNSVGRTTVNAGSDWLGTVRGRLGYLVTPSLLAYATGGLTYGGIYANVGQVAFSSLGLTNGSTANYTFAGGRSSSQNSVGWNVGGGFEWMFLPNWSLKGEGIYWNLGNLNIPSAALAAAPNAPLEPLATIGNVRVNYQGVIARAGINYHFNLSW